MSLIGETMPKALGNAPSRLAFFPLVPEILGVGGGAMVVSPADRSWGWPTQKTFLWISAVTAGVEGRPFSVFAKDFMPMAHFSLEGPFPTRLL